MNSVVKGIGMEEFCFFSACNTCMLRHTLIWTLSGSLCQVQSCYSESLYGVRRCVFIISTLEPISVLYNTDNQLKHKVLPIV